MKFTLQQIAVVSALSCCAFGQAPPPLVETVPVPGPIPEIAPGAQTYQKLNDAVSNHTPLEEKVFPQVQSALSPSEQKRLDAARGQDAKEAQAKADAYAAQHPEARKEAERIVEKVSPDALKNPKEALKPGITPTPPSGPQIMTDPRGPHEREFWSLRNGGPLPSEPKEAKSPDAATSPGSGLATQKPSSPETPAKAPETHVPETIPARSRNTERGPSGPSSNPGSQNSNNSNRSNSSGRQEYRSSSR